MFRAGSTSGAPWARLQAATADTVPGGQNATHGRGLAEHRGCSERAGGPLAWAAPSRCGASLCSGGGRGGVKAARDCATTPRARQGASCNFTVQPSPQLRDRPHSPGQPLSVSSAHQPGHCHSFPATHGAHALSARSICPIASPDQRPSPPRPPARCCPPVQTGASCSPPARRRAACSPLRPRSTPRAHRLAARKLQTVPANSFDPPVDSCLACPLSLAYQAARPPRRMTTTLVR